MVTRSPAMECREYTAKFGDSIAQMSELLSENHPTEEGCGAPVCPYIYRLAPKPASTAPNIARAGNAAIAASKRPACCFGPKPKRGENPPSSRSQIRLTGFVLITPSGQAGLAVAAGNATTDRAQEVRCRRSPAPAEAARPRFCRYRTGANRDGRHARGIDRSSV